MGIDTVRISGKLVCDYIWFLRRQLNEEEREFISNCDNEPDWTMDTELLVTFNKSLLAGNITNGSSVPTNWVIYRRDTSDGSMQLASITDTNQTSIYDYNVVNGKEYEYILFASSSGYITTPIMSDKVKTEWSNYCLFDVTETDIENKFMMHDCYMFDLNIEPESVSNNLLASKLDNFTRYPKFIKSPSNHYSGTLTGLLGYIGEDGEYHDSPEMLDAFMEFSVSPRRKFLKDRRGHIYEVEISGAVTESTWGNFGGREPYQISIPWTQVGNTKELMIN